MLSSIWSKNVVSDLSIARRVVSACSNACLMFSSFKCGVEQRVCCSYLLLHRQMCRAYLLVECHVFLP